MDPNACLEEIRRIVERHGNSTVAEDDSDRLYELVECLDEWITRGGFLPKPWGERQRSRVADPYSP